ncbi:MAG: MarR family winged helix-turn-helix transcriptional regulator [Geminicoccaceae bacterium]
MENKDIEAPYIRESVFSRNVNIRAIRLGAKISQLLQKLALTPADIPIHEFRILLSLARRGATHLRKLAVYASMDPAHVSRTVRQMEQKGWLTRRTSKEDARLVVLCLTTEGRRTVDRALPAVIALDRDISSVYAPNELEQLLDLLDRGLRHADARLDEAT